MQRCRGEEAGAGVTSGGQVSPNCSAKLTSPTSSFGSPLPPPLCGCPSLARTEETRSNQQARNLVQKERERHNEAHGPRTHPRGQSESKTRRKAAIATSCERLVRLVPSTHQRRAHAGNVTHALARPVGTATPDRTADELCSIRPIAGDRWSLGAERYLRRPPPKLQAEYDNMIT